MTQEDTSTTVPVTWIPVGNALRGQLLAQGPKPWPVIESIREETGEYVIALRFARRLDHIRVRKAQEIPVA